MRAFHPHAMIKRAAESFSIALFYTLFLSPASLLFAASIRHVSGDEMSKRDAAATNTNFENINRELSNTVHKTSTETIKGYKYFVDPIDFGTITGDSATITGLTVSTFTASSATITGLSVSTLTVASLTTLTGSFSMSGTWDGWIGASETWTYSTSSQFTVSGDVTGKYNVGDRLKLTQTGTKYFYVTSSAYTSSVTTITVTGGSDYSIANAAITSPYYSKMQTPNGFPQYFNFTPTWTSAGTQPTIGDGTLTGRFSLNGRTISVQFRFEAGATTTFGTSRYYFAMPVDPSTTELSAINFIGQCGMFDSSAGFAYVGFPGRVNGASNIEIGYHSDTLAGGISNYVSQTGPFTWAASDTVSGTYQYEIQ